MVESLSDVRRWLRLTHGNRRCYMTQVRRRNGLWVYQFYTVQHLGLVRLAPERPEDPFQRAKLRRLGWNAQKDAWISDKSGNLLLTEAAASLGWVAFEVDWEVLR